MNYASEVLTELKIRESELIDEKIDYLASAIRNYMKISMNCSDTKYSRMAANEFAMYTFQAIKDANIEHEFIEHLIKFFENGNVSRLDNDPILEDIINFLVDSSDIEDERMEDQVELEISYDELINYNAFTSKNIEAPTYISGIEKEKVRMHTIYNKTK